MSKKKRILVTACGGSPAMGFIRSLRDAPEEYHIVGCDCDRYTLQRSQADESYLCPGAKDPLYIPFIRDLVDKNGIDFIHAQPDIEVGVLSENRDKLGTRTFLPSKETVSILRDKSRSYEIWKDKGLQVPETMFINDHEDLKSAFDRFGKDIWLREIEGAAGRGSLSGPTYSLAREWIESRNGWGRYTAAQRLTDKTVTWMSLYKDGNLIVAQGRRRMYWEFSNRAQSGVTGITGSGMTVSDPEVDRIARQSVKAVDNCPEGIFSVDLTYDKNGVPNPTEINVGKFFTTHYFFTKAGLNMPYIYLKLAFDEDVPVKEGTINPLPEGLLWIRGMDMEPVLTDEGILRESVSKFNEMKGRIECQSVMS